MTHILSTGGGKALMNVDDSLLLLLDHQSGLFQTVKDITVAELRVVGGFTAHQFVEKRLPTIDELNAAAPDTPVFLLHLYDRAILNGAALRAVGYTKETPKPPGGEIVRDVSGIRWLNGGECSALTVEAD
jgi:predicted amidohydrolase YtcJ